MAVDKQLLAKRCPFFRDNYAQHLREDADAPIHLTGETLGTLNVFTKWLYADVVPRQVKFPADAHRAAEAAYNLVDFYLLAERYRLPNGAKILVLDELLDLYRRTAFRMFGLMPRVMVSTAGLAESPLRRLMIDIACDGFLKGSHTHEQIISGCNNTESSEFDTAVAQFSNERPLSEHVFRAKQFNGDDVSESLAVAEIPRYQIGFLAKQEASLKTAATGSGSVVPLTPLRQNTGFRHFSASASAFVPQILFGPFKGHSGEISLADDAHSDWLGVKSLIGQNSRSFDSKTFGVGQEKTFPAGHEEREYATRGNDYKRTTTGKTIATLPSGELREDDKESNNGSSLELHDKENAMVSNLTDLEGKGIRCCICGAANGHRVW